MESIIVEIVLFLLLVVLAGLIKAAEIAISSIGENKIEQLKSEQNKTAALFEKVKQDPESFFGSLQLIYTVIIISAAITGIILLGNYEGLVNGSTLSPEILSGNYIFSIISIIIVASIIIVGCLLIPTAVGFKYSSKLAINSVRILLAISLVIKYPVRVLTSISNFILKLFKEKTSFTQYRPSEDEILDIISDGVKSGAIDETEQEIIENVLEFNDLKADEVMIPRTEMIAVDITDDNDEIIKEIVKSGHSLIPAFEETPDNIVGVIHTKDMMKLFIEGKPVLVKQLLRPAHYIPETKPISQVLKEMQQIGERLVIVTDEYGGTEGIITIEDVLEEIVGEIKDKTKVEINKLSKFADGTFCVHGSMDIDEFNENFSSVLPESEIYNTVAGFVAEQTGKILNPGESFEYEAIRFELIKKIRQKMVQFRVSFIKEEPGS